MKYIELREHLITNNFEPTLECPLATKFPITLYNTGASIFAEFQHFLNSHINTQKYIRLLNIELPMQLGWSWSLHKNDNIIVPQIAISNEGETFPTNISV